MDESHNKLGIFQPPGSSRTALESPASQVRCNLDRPCVCVEEDSRGPLQLSRIGGRLPPWFPHKRSSPHKSFHPPPPTLSPAYNASDDENKGDHLLGVLVQARGLHHGWVNLAVCPTNQVTRIHRGLHSITEFQIEESGKSGCTVGPD